jgi:hypothetical protein
MDQEIFQNNSGFYYIQQDKYEPRELYLERVWFILSKINNQNEFDNLEKKSKMMINEKYLGCTY